jgi:hypothetical protein
MTERAERRQAALTREGIAAERAPALGEVGRVRGSMPDEDEIEEVRP